jgi:hypothetical protein
LGEHAAGGKGPALCGLSKDGSGFYQDERWGDHSLFFSIYILCLRQAGAGSAEQKTFTSITSEKEPMDWMAMAGSRTLVYIR